MIQGLLDHFTELTMGVGLLVVFVLMQSRNKEAKLADRKIKQAQVSQTHEPLSLHPELDPAQCIGCGSCTQACPEGTILQLINHKATLVAPTKCVGHGECEAACPMGAIKLVFGTKTRGMDIPRLTTNYETNVSGLYIAGELGGMGLIRNAVKQGSLAAGHAVSNLSSGAVTDTDVLVIGAGPAGLAASLKVIQARKRYICIDQNSFGGTVANFPRQKLVMSHPFDLPMVGVCRFPGNEVQKDELLALWREIQNQTQFKVQEGVKFENLSKQLGYFSIQTTAGEITAQKVILALGVRGAPRRLGVAGEEKTKVTYNLIDPEQYQERCIAVVGAGNAAVEAALMLAREDLRNAVTLLVRGVDFDRCNDENKKRILKMSADSRVQIFFETKIDQIHETELYLTRGGQSMKLRNDFVVVQVGSDSPHKFLMSLGVEIEKKFGEELRPV